MLSSELVVIEMLLDAVEITIFVNGPNVICVCCRGYVFVFIPGVIVVAGIDDVLWCSRVTFSCVAGRYDIDSVRQLDDLLYV